MAGARYLRLPRCGRRGGAAGVVISPIGFVSDHIEVLWDLDTEALGHAAELGLPAVRAATAGTHPAFVAGLADLVQERIADVPLEQRPALTELGPGWDACPVGCCPNPRGERPALCGRARDVADLDGATGFRRASAAAGDAGCVGGGELLLARPADLVVESKSSATDAVTAMDRASEDLLVRMLLADGATDAVLGEEESAPAARGALGARPAGRHRQLPLRAAGVGCERGRAAARPHGRGRRGAPLLQRRWWAVAGGGAWTALGDDEPRRLQVGGERRLGHALTGTGFGYAADRRGRQGSCWPG